MEKMTPELLASAGSVEEVGLVCQAGADAVVIGSQAYALRAHGDFDLSMIQSAVDIAHPQGKKVYVLVNALLHHDAARHVPAYISELHRIGVDAIVFGDPAVLMAARQVAPAMKLHWNTETTSTNYRTVQYWAKKGAKRAVLARELSLAEIAEIKRHSDIEIQMQIHGLTCIFHSKREVVTNYASYQGNEPVPLEARSLFLKEHTRSEQQYPIFEDVHGTHIMSSEDICMLEHLEECLQTGADSFFIEGHSKTPAYNSLIVAIYRQAIDELMKSPADRGTVPGIEAIRKIQPQNRPLGTGFYYKAQIY